MSITERTGVPAASRLLGSSSSTDWLRGIERLGAFGDERALDQLLDLLDGGQRASRDPQARLLTVRMLAPFADREPVAIGLAKVLGGERGKTSFAALLRDTAAMALAASGDGRSLEILTAALARGGLEGESARKALLAHPPATLLPFPAPDAMAPAVSAVLGELGDRRALDSLRTTLERARSSMFVDQTVAAAAAVALAKLGDEAVIEIAKEWVAKGSIALKLAGAEVLAIRDSKEAGQVMAELLSVERSREKALELAVAHPKEALVGPLLGIVRAGDPQGAKLATKALGKLATAGSLAALEALLTEPHGAGEAARALSLTKAKGAREALERALVLPETRRLAALAGAVRALVLGDAPSGLEKALDALLRSEDPADRAAAAFGFSALDDERAARFLRSEDPVVLRAAAMAIEPVRLAALLPTTTLLAFSKEERSALAHRALHALGYRDGDRMRHRLEIFLTSPDPVLRAHAARALGQSSQPDASARLGRAYAFETEASVRLAVVRALSERREPQRLRALELAARLDADPATREAARRALGSGDSAKASEPDATILDLAFSSLAENSPAP